MGRKFICKKNPLQDLLSSLNSVISTNERNGILADHVIFKLRYNEIYHMKTTNDLNHWPKSLGNWLKKRIHRTSLVRGILHRGSLCVSVV